jgi:hypothetical protein
LGGNGGGANRTRARVPLERERLGVDANAVHRNGCLRARRAAQSTTGEDDEADVPAARLEVTEVRRRIRKAASASAIEVAKVVPSNREVIRPSQITRRPVLHVAIFHHQNHHLPGGWGRKVSGRAEVDRGRRGNEQPLRVAERALRSRRLPPWRDREVNPGVRDHPISPSRQSRWRNGERQQRRYNHELHRWTYDKRADGGPYRRTGSIHRRIEGPHLPR